MGGNGEPSQDPQDAIKLELPLPHVPQHPTNLSISKTERLRGFRDSLKKKLTCRSAKVTVRIIKLAVSLWQLADMVSDGLNTLMYLHFAEVKMRFLHFRQS